MKELELVVKLVAVLLLLAVSSHEGLFSHMLITKGSDTVYEHFQIRKPSLRVTFLILFC